jgi:CheY-like chemotaxis protein
MPHVDGRQVAERIKGNSPRTPVILLTGWGAMLDEKQANQSHIDAVVSKPPRLTELNETLLRVTSIKIAA